MVEVEEDKADHVVDDCVDLMAEEDRRVTRGGSARGCGHKKRTHA